MAQDLRADLRVLDHQRPLLGGQRAGLEQDRVGHGDLADVVEQEAELDLGVDLDAGGVGDPQPVGGDALGVLARVGVARLDRVGERQHGRLVGAAQLLRAVALLLEDLAQVGRVVLELALARGGLALEAREPRAQRGDGVLAMGCSSGRTHCCRGLLPHAGGRSSQLLTRRAPEIASVRSERLTGALEDDLRDHTVGRGAQQEADGLGDVLRAGSSAPGATCSRTNSVIARVDEARAQRDRLDAVAVELLVHRLRPADHAPPWWRSRRSATPGRSCPRSTTCSRRARCGARRRRRAGGRRTRGRRGSPRAG